MPRALKDGKDTTEELCIFLLWGKVFLTNNLILAGNEECFLSYVQISFNAGCVTKMKKYYKNIMKADVSTVYLTLYAVNVSVYNYSIASTQRVICHFSTANFKCITYITVALNYANKDNNKNTPDLVQKSLKIWPG